jgi:hypothetical protein
MSGQGTHPLISVVVVNYNGIQFLKNCFSSIYQQKFTPYEVILVDNASIDGSAEYVRKNFPDVKIVIQSSNSGFAGGANTGIREAKGEFILTLNNDTIAGPEFIEELFFPMISDPDVGMCASKMVLPDGRINSTGICISKSGEPWDRGGGQPDDGQYDSPEEVFGPCAGAALYRRSMLEEIGLFDEDFFLYFEDVDLAFRAQLSGWKCVYVPKACIVHVHGGTAGFKSDISIYYVNRNLVWYIVKNFPARTFFRYLPWIVLRNTADIFYYACNGMLFTIVRAKKDMLRGIPNMIKKRKQIKKTVSDASIENWILQWRPIRSRQNVDSKI